MALSKIQNNSYDTDAVHGQRNLIINGSCVIDQRNNGASVSGNAVFPIDRWKHFEAQSSKFTSIQRSTDAPANFINSVAYTSASSYSVIASDYFTHEQPVEGYTAAHLGWGTANAKTVTLSFWVKSSLTGTFGGAVYSGTGSYGYPFSYTISSANTWEEKSITIAGPTSGTFTTDNSTAFVLCFSLGMGSDYTYTAGSWQAGTVRSATGETSVVGTSGATWYITGIQLEVGSDATPFEHRSYGDELARCQRYYQQLGNSSYVTIGLGILGAARTSTRGHVQYAETMRAVPSITISGTLITTDRDGYDTDISSINGSSAGLSGAFLSFAHSATGTALYPSMIAVKNGTTSSLKLDAEL